MSHLYLDALAGINYKRPPVWLMRQAGRYLPSYRALKNKYSLEELFHTPELATLVTLQPIDQFGLDAAILFSDILVIHEALGYKVSYPETGGPLIVNAPSTLEEIESIQILDVLKSLQYVKETIKELRRALQVPLIGFCGAPFTVCAYLLDRPLKEDMKNTKNLMFEHSDVFHRLLVKVTKATKMYLEMQIEAGAQAIQIFDSWANALSYSDFKEFCLPHLDILVKAVQAKAVPVTVFCRGSSLHYQELVSLQPNAISFDWQQDLKKLRDKVPSHIAIQGNLDPSLLKADPNVVSLRAKKLLNEMKGCPNFIVNLGHGILPDSKVESVKALIDTVKNF